MSNDFSDMGSVKALLTDARERIKESEERSSKKTEEVEKRLTNRLDELEEQIIKLNTKMIEWLPLLTQLSKAEETKRNMNITLLVSFITNVCAWILTIFIYFIKSGVLGK